MSLMINQNITSLNAWRNLNKTDRSMGATMEKLSSGLRINKAADDPSGLVISEQMRAQVVGLKAAIKNSEKGISMIQTAEGALDKVHSLLDKMRGLALDSANNATSDANMLAANQAEVSNILDTITRISDNTQYGTKKLLNGDNWSATASLSGTNNTAGVTQVAESNLRAGVTGTQIVTVSDIVTADTIFNLGNLGPAAGAGTGIDWSSAGADDAAAAALASGKHTISVTGSLDTVGAATISDANVTGEAANAADFWTGSYSGALTLQVTSAGATQALDGTTYNVYEGAVAAENLVGTASFATATNAFTVVYADGSQNATLDFGAALGGTIAQNATVALNVTASSATASLDGGPTLNINKSDLTALSLTSGTGGTAEFDFDNAGIFDGNTNTTTFQVQKNGQGMARIGDGAKVVVGSNDTAVTLSNRDGSVTLDFGSIAAGTSQLTVADNSLVFQVGANQGQTVNIGIQDVAANHMAVVSNATAGSALAGVSSGASLADINITTTSGAQDAVIMIDAAIDEISVIRGDLGAFQANTLEANLDSLRVSAENLQASESIIRDTDMAAEMAEFTKYQIMMQAGTSMLAQANQIPNNLLSLLR